MAPHFSHSFINSFGALLTIFVLLDGIIAFPSASRAPSRSLDQHVEQSQFECTLAPRFQSEENFRPHDCIKPMNFFREKARRLKYMDFEFLSLGHKGSSQLPRALTPIKMSSGKCLLSGLLYSDGFHKRTE